jgi:hypothetical protein
MTGTLVALCCGCIPLYATVRQPKSGKVIDSEPQNPIVNAVVRVESYMVPTPPGHGGRGTLKHVLEVKTDANGRWFVPRERDWTIGILAADGLPLYVDVYCVFADGYRDEIRNPYKAWLGFAGQKEEGGRENNEMPLELRLVRGPRGAGSAPVGANRSASRSAGRCEPIIRPDDALGIHIAWWNRGGSPQFLGNIANLEKHCLGGRAAGGANRTGLDRSRIRTCHSRDPCRRGRTPSC